MWYNVEKCHNSSQHSTAFGLFCCYFDVYRANYFSLEVWLLFPVMSELSFFFFTFSISHIKSVQVYKEETFRWHYLWLQIKSRDIYTKTARCIVLYSILGMWITIPKPLWMKRKPPVIIVLLDICPSIVLIVKISPLVLAWIFPFHVSVMISGPFTGSFYLNKGTIFYLVLYKTCMYCDNFHLNVYFSLSFWLLILCSQVWWWNFSL